MSEERRKRQEERNGTGDGKTKKVLTYGVVVILLAGAFIAGRTLQESQVRCFREVPGDEADHDVRSLLVPALH
jgi:hypothetical protein